MSDTTNFAKQVIKGKIAEMVFEFMFRQGDAYDVIPFGYEYSQPQIAQHINLLKEKDVLEVLRDRPDFLLISKDKTEVYFVEVKYRKVVDIQELITKAEKLVDKWNHSFLFVASAEGFYYSPCHTIINEKCIEKLQERIIPKGVQDEYLQLLNEFEK